MNFPSFETHYNICHEMLEHPFVECMDKHGVDEVDAVLMSNIHRHICRAKDVDTGEWVYGYYVVAPDEYAKGELNHAIFTFKCEHICMGEYKDWRWHEVDPSTVCRCTGIWDDNNCLVFEHDIVRTSKEVIGEILWVDLRGYAGWYMYKHGKMVDGKFVKNNLDMTFDPRTKSIVVIGNKFDNTKLTE